MSVSNDADKTLGELRKLLNKRLACVADGMTAHDVASILGEPTEILTGRAANEYDEDIDTVFAYRDPYGRRITNYFGFSIVPIQKRPTATTPIQGLIWSEAGSEKAYTSGCAPPNVKKAERNGKRQAITTTSRTVKIFLLLASSASLSRYFM